MLTIDFCNYEQISIIHMKKNIKNHILYSNKLILRVIDLTHIDLATEEDLAYGIDHWARLFKASTWEELKMIAKTVRFSQKLPKHSINSMPMKSCGSAAVHERTLSCTRTR